MKTATAPATTLLDEPQTGGKELQTVNDSATVVERFARDPAIDVEKLERLIAMQERIAARTAEEQFNAAMSAAQKQMRSIEADGYNPSTKSKFATYAALDRALRPIYTDHGFGLSFDTGDAPPDTVRMLCYVTHIAGHARTYHADMPADGKGAKGGDVMTKTHAVGSAMSYGMRYLLKMIWNVAIWWEDDDDGNAAGDKGDRPDAPKGFEAWVLDLEAAIPQGTAALMKAFNCGAEPLRLHLVKQHKASWESLKVRAAEVTKKGGRS